MPVPPVIQMYRYVMGSGGGVSNLLLGSEQLGSTGVGRWNGNLMNAVNSDQVNNPADTEQTADQLDFQADKRARIIQDVTLVAGTEYTFSVWARAASGTQDFRLSYWDNVGRNFGTSAHTASATWSPTTGRYSFTFTAGSSGTFSMYIQNAADGVSRSIYFWGAMLNIGATAAQYIKTEFPFGPSNPITPPMEFGDNFAGVTAYYSVRRFTRGAENNAIRVRKEVSSVDYEMDIGFDSNGGLDTTTLVDFASDADGGNVYVSIWYDQSGNGNDATNSNESEQPLVVSGGTLVEENGKAAIDLDGVDDSFTANALAGLSRLDIFFAHQTTDSQYVQFSEVSSITDRGFTANSGDSGSGLPSNMGTPTMYNNGTQFTGTTRDDVQTAQNGHQVISYIDADTTAFSTFEIGGHGSYVFDGKFQELIFFDSDQSGNRGSVSLGTGIEGNINEYFGIV